MMSKPITRIALSGATGTVGASVLEALLSASYHVLVITRSSSATVMSLPAHTNLKVVSVDVTDVDALLTVFKGNDIEAVVSCVGSDPSAILGQKKLIDAAIATGTVRRFIPSSFGADLTHPSATSIPFNAPKVEVIHYLRQAVAESSDSLFSFTSISNGSFFDWCLQGGFFGGKKNTNGIREMTLWDGGDVPFSVTTLASVGRAVASVFVSQDNLEATKNREIKVADTTFTLKELMMMIKETVGDKKDDRWIVKEAPIEPVYEAGKSDLDQIMQGNDGDYQSALFKILVKVMFAADTGVDFTTTGLDNALLDLQTMTSEDVRMVVSACIDRS